MEEPQLSTPSLLDPQIVHDVSLWGLFLQADIVVKVVMAMLLFASVWCWAIIFYKAMAVRRARASADQFEDRFWSGRSLDDLYDEIGDDPANPMEAVFTAAMQEWRHSNEANRPRGDHIRAGLSSRLDKVMTVAVQREMGAMERGMTVLASVGSTAPFVGLFGTVWGIMNSFVAIAGSGNTSLAVVAPGIAEALFATALGLFAAIPATAAYNKFANDLGKLGERMDNFAGEFSTILGRYMDERG